MALYSMVWYAILHELELFYEQYISFDIVSKSIDLESPKGVRILWQFFGNNTLFVHNITAIFVLYDDNNSLTHIYVILDGYSLITLKLVIFTVKMSAILNE